MIRSAVAVRGNKGVTGNITANAGDVKVRAVIGNAVFGNGSTVDVDDFSISLEKPGFFIVDYDVSNQDFRFQFMNTLNVLEKQFNWTYSHSRNDNRTVLDGSLVLDQANKVSASYKLGSRNCKLKYSYVYRGITAVEPGYDFEKNSWDLAVSHRLANDVVRASYENVSKNLGVEWLWKSLLSPEGGIKSKEPFNSSSSSSADDNRLNCYSSKLSASISTKSPSVSPISVPPPATMREEPSHHPPKLEIKTKDKDLRNSISINNSSNKNNNNYSISSV